MTVMLTPTVREMVPIKRSDLERRLAEELRPETYTIQRGGVPDVLPNRDPVLRVLAPAAGSQYLDERVYDSLWIQESKLGDARRHLEEGIFRDDFEVQGGPSGSPEAARFQEFAETLWAGLPHKRTVLKRLHDSYYYGWRPMQVLVDREATFEGKPVWLPRALVNKRHHHVRVTLRGSVVWTPDGHFRSEEFDGLDRALGWLLWRIGDLEHPYGAGLLQTAWLLVYTKRSIFRKFQRGLDREMGMLKLSNTSGAQVEDSVDEVLEEIDAILELLNSYNVAVELKGWQLEMLDGVEFVGSALDVLKYLDDSIQTLICGEVLTGNPGDRGTQALGTVHRSVKEGYALDASLETIEEPISQLLRTFVDANFGQQDEEDYPRLVNRTRLKVGPDVVQKIFDFGGPIRLRRFAELHGAGGLLATGEEDEDEMVVRKQQPPANPFGPMLDDGEDPEDLEPDEEPDDDRTRRAAERGDRLRREIFAETDTDQHSEALAKALGQAARAGTPSYRRRVREVFRRWLEERRLPADP